MDKTINEILSLGFTMTKNQNNALVYDVFYNNSGPLSKQQFKEIKTEIFDPSQPDLAIKGAQPRVLAEGDSWINILWPLSALLGHERTFFDVIERTNRFWSKDFAFPGDKFEDMLADKEYKTDLKSASYQYFIFSGGGNDVLGGGALRRILKDRENTDPGKPVTSWLEMAQVDQAFKKISRGYEALAAETAVYASGKTTLLIHGYDYPIPRHGEPWLGEPLEDRGYDLVRDVGQISKIFTYLIDRLYDTLAGVVQSNSNARLLDLRTVVGGRWNDELHPKTEASKDIAKLFMNELVPLS